MRHTARQCKCSGRWSWWTSPGTGETGSNVMGASHGKMGAYCPQAGFREKLSCEEKLKSLAQLISGIINKGNIIVYQSNE